MQLFHVLVGDRFDAEVFLPSFLDDITIFGNRLSQALQVTRRNTRLVMSNRGRAVAENPYFRTVLCRPFGDMDMNRFQWLLLI